MDNLILVRCLDSTGYYYAGFCIRWTYAKYAYAYQGNHHVTPSNIYLHLNSPRFTYATLARIRMLVLYTKHFSTLQTCPFFRKKTKKNVIFFKLKFFFLDVHAHILTPVLDSSSCVALNIFQHFSALLHCSAHIVLA